MGTRTIECNSWDSIVNALIAEAIEDETDRVIHLTNDIDLNYSYPDGVSVTSIATSGSSVFATPIKDVTYFPVFTPSSDVPVFPPT